MYKLLKRLLDLIVSLFALVLLAPVLLPTMLILRLTGEREVFYRQERLGYKNQPFSILKFATMLKNSPNMAGGEITLRGDPRVLPFGKFLRRTKINELPQLWNVFRGEMSLVGPRPLMEVSFNLYSKQVRQVVYESPPGLTGIGSIVFRDEERLVTDTPMDPRKFYAEVIYPYKGEIEMWYFRNRGFATDLKILVLTAWAIFRPESDLHRRFFPELPSPPPGLFPNAAHPKQTTEHIRQTGQ